MKKNLAKIFASCSIVVAIILIMILLVTAFGGISTDEFDSQLVRGLLITLAILYIALSAITLTLIFINSDVVKEITLRAEQGGSVRVSSTVITKLVKNACKDVDGVKGRKVTVITDEYGARLKVNVKVVDKDVIEAETYLRTLLEDVFMKEFGFAFHSIEIKVMSLQSKYQADQAEINKRVEEKLSQLRQEKAEAAQDDGEQTDVAETAETVEEKAVEEPVAEIVDNQTDEEAQAVSADAEENIEE